MKIFKIAQSYEAYHGTDTQFDAFAMGFSGEGHNSDQEGPGIYFTNSQQNAEHYGSEVHSVSLNFNKAVPLTGEINQSEIEKLILWSCGLENESDLENIDQDVFWNSGLTDWGEYPQSAFLDAVNNVMTTSKGPHDAFQNVWIMFYRHDVVEYLQNMIKLGYDGVIVPKDVDGVIHYIVFNPQIIEKR